jgi:hypothetical protein
MTVADELLNRRDCRYRIRGVRIEHGGRAYLVAESRWAADSELAVALVPADVTAGVMPPAREVAAGECILAGYRSVACRRPSRWHEHNSPKKAKAAGLAMPVEIAARFETVSPWVAPRNRAAR